GAEGSIGAAKGTTGAAFAKDIRRRLKDSGLEGLAESNPEVAALLSEAEGMENLTTAKGGRARRNLLQRLQGVVVPIAEEQLAATEARIEAEKTQVKGSVAETVAAIEAQRGN